MEPVDSQSATLRKSNRTRFTPNLLAATQRSTKVDLVADSSSVVDTFTMKNDSRTGNHPMRGRGHGRGRGGNGNDNGREIGKGGTRVGQGLLSSASLSAELYNNEVISGPFAHGPASLTRSRNNDTTNISSSRPSTISTNTATRTRTKPDKALEGEANMVTEHDQVIINMESLTAKHRQSSFPMRLGSDHSSKHDPLLTKGVNTDTKSIIQDDDYIDGAAFLASSAPINGTGPWWLMQLPSSILPKMQGEGIPSTPLNPTVTIPIKGGEREEEAIDIESFKSLQEAATANQQQRTTRWPINCQGQLGKLRVHASGRISLILGDETSLTAMPSSFTTSIQGKVTPSLAGQQRAVAIDADYQQSFDLGPIQHKLIFIPTNLSSIESL